MVTIINLPVLDKLCSFQNKQFMIFSYIYKCTNCSEQVKGLLKTSNLGKPLSDTHRCNRIATTVQSAEALRLQTARLMIPCSIPGRFTTARSARRPAQPSAKECFP